MKPEPRTGETRSRKKPLRLRRKARRLVYRSVHAALPTRLRQVLRRAVKGPPPTAEELEARREAAFAQKAALEERKQSRLRMRDRAAWFRREAVAVKRRLSELKRMRSAAERTSRQLELERRRRREALARDRAAWIKRESEAARRDEAEERKAKRDDERRAQRVATEQQKQRRSSLRDRMVWLKRESGAGRRDLATHKKLVLAERRAAAERQKQAQLRADEQAEWIKVESSATGRAISELKQRQERERRVAVRERAKQAAAHMSPNSRRNKERTAWIKEHMLELRRAHGESNGSAPAPHE